MSTRTTRPRRRRPTSSGSHPVDPGDATRPRSPAKLDTRDSRPLLARILDTPHVAQLIPRLPADVLHRVIERCGLEDCGELLTLATPVQLTRVFDLDLWRSNRPGLDEQFDAERFGVWLEVLVESDVAAAAHTLAGLDAAFVTAALAQHILVFDPAAQPASVEHDGEDIQGDLTPDNGLSCEVGGYLITARRTDVWDAIVAVLIALGAEHPDAFHRVMGGCRKLSNSTPEIDGLDDLLTDAEQVTFDLALDRERRREKQGYTTPVEARAFLQMSRQLKPGHEPAPTAIFAATAYFRAMDQSDAADESGEENRSPQSQSSSTPSDDAPSVAALVDVLTNEGVLPRPTRALLHQPQGHASRLARIQAYLEFAQDSDAAAYLVRCQELAFLANMLASGCSIQARPFTPQEASDAAVAVCNLGLENWTQDRPTGGSRRGPAGINAATLPEDFLVHHELVTVFQVGWSVLHQQVCMYAAEELVRVLSSLTCADREIQAGLNGLRSEMKKHWRAGEPWRARDALDVVTNLDMPAWATLLGLIDECPVVHAGLSAVPGSGTRTVNASAFEFISENSQIASVRAYMQSLPVTLSS